MDEETLQEVTKAVESINRKIRKFLPTSVYSLADLLEIQIKGYIPEITVQYMGRYIWGQDNDCRDYIPEKDDYEPLEGYLCKEIMKLVQQTSKIDI